VGVGELGVEIIMSFTPKLIAGLIVSTIALVLIMMAGLPAYGRYQDRQNAANDVVVSNINIQNQAQHVEIEKKKAEVRVAEANGIAESQRIIASSLTDSYLQYLAIKAQEAMATGPNHTEIYIPSGMNGIPLVKTVDSPVAEGKPIKK
jgi:hypothetical protein